MVQVFTFLRKTLTTVPHWATKDHIGLRMTLYNFASHYIVIKAEKEMTKGLISFDLLAKAQLEAHINLKA